MKILLIISTLLLSANVFAKTYTAPWGMAGCDLWANVIKGKDQGSQLGVYALRNLVLNSQTSAISSGTSGCVEKAVDYANKEQEVFIDVNLATLQAEAARGSGNHLDALAEVLGCEDKAGFNTLSKEKFDGIFSTQEPKSVLDNYKKEIKSSAIAKSCVRVS